MRRSIEQIEAMIQDKVMGHSRTSADQFRRTFKLFNGRVAEGMTPHELAKQLRTKFGLPVAMEELRELVQKYDCNQNGRIDVSFEMSAACK